MSKRCAKGTVRATRPQTAPDVVVVLHMHVTMGMEGTTTQEARKKTVLSWNQFPLPVCVKKGTIQKYALGEKVYPLP